MKVLFVTPYIYAPEFEEHRKNKSGFGIMVKDIAAAVSKAGNEVLVLTRTFGPGRRGNGFFIIPNSFFRNMIHGKYKGIFQHNAALQKAGVSLKARLKELYYYLNLGYIEFLIKREKPDVVHIHGCSTVISETMEACRKHSVPFVVSLHGLLQDDPGADEYLKHCERELIGNAQNAQITVISSRMKERFLSAYYGASSNENVAVITNGIDVNVKEKTCNIKETLGIADETKIILSVGSVCGLKNQIQTLRAFSQLPAGERDGAALVFVGAVHADYKIREEVERLNLKEKVFFAGFVPRDELKNYYSVADITVTASLTEGFGIPIVEGFVYGVPCVTFADLDAIDDIYDENAMCLCKDRSDESYSAALLSALQTKWDKLKIMEHSKKFSLEVMAQKYNGVYKSLS